MWWRQGALALNGTAGVQASGKGPSSYTAQLPTPTGRSVQQGGRPQNHDPAGTLITAQALNGGLNYPDHNKRTVPITQLYDRRYEEVSLDEARRIVT